MEPPDVRPLILLTGASGYVGGRLLPVLHAAGFPVRCTARRPEVLTARVPAGVEVVRGDVLDASTLPAALAGVHTAYYLVHSMASAGSFEDLDRQAAANFAAAAANAGVKRIIYLGGLGEDGAGLSAHLRSRHETGDVLRQGGVPVIEFRASIVLGSGSLSFEMIRALVERLPFMVTPRWVGIRAQPIAIDDLVAYLVAAIDLPQGPSRTFEIGGADQLSYGELMKEYARQRGLRRWMIPVPVLTPWLSSLWLGLVTPLYARIGRKLIRSIRHPTVVRDPSALEVFAVRPKSAAEAIAAALRNEDREFAQSRWSDSVGSAGPPRDWTGVRFGNRLFDRRRVRVPVEPAQAFAPVRRIGGDTGWYFADFLWRIRGAMDLLIGGPGMRRGRADPDRLRMGDVVDCWRVEQFEPDRRLRLCAEMKMPGRAWLEFEVAPEPDGGSTITQTAVFDPVGLAGLLYWVAVRPLHEPLFSGMLRGIAAAAVRGRRDVRIARPRRLGAVD